MNKTTKHYFMNLFKRKKKILVLYTFICFMAYPFLEIASLFANGDSNILAEITHTSFVLALCVLGVLAAVLPIFTFKFSHTKKHVDTYFAVPMNRNHLFKSHFMAPILGTCIPLLINYLIGGVILVMFRGSIANYFELLCLLLLAIAIFVVVYSVNTYFVLNANNVLDSAIITIGVAALPLVFSSAVNWFIDSQIVKTGMIEIYQITDEIIKLLLPYTGFVLISDAFETGFRDVGVNFYQIEWFYIIYYFIIGIIFYFLSKKVFKKKKGENAEQLTTSFVTYPMMINVGLVSLTLLFNIAQMELVAAVLSVIALFVIYILANAIANRSMIISSKMIVKFVILLVIINGFNFISKETEFFGINRQVIDYTKYDYVEINYYSYDSKFDENGDIVNYYYKFDINDMNSDEKEFFELLKEFQKDRSIALKETGSTWRENVYGNLDISYITSDGVKEYSHRYAYFDITKSEQTKLVALINAFIVD